MKATKKQAKEIYDSFYGTLRCLNGGTREENERSAKRCYEGLKEDAELARNAAFNPSKRLSEDEWLMTALKTTIPARLKSFAERYDV